MPRSLAETKTKIDALADEIWNVVASADASDAWGALGMIVAETFRVIPNPRMRRELLRQWIAILRETALTDEADDGPAQKPH